MLTEVAKALRATVRRVLSERPGLAARSKADGSWVTELDLSLQDAISEDLARYAPDIPLLGEELSATSQRRMMQKERLLWILDPLDGTSNLVAGLPFYAVSLALREAGAITHGWVYDPNRDELFMAQAGCGAWLDGQALVLDDCPGQLSDCVALIDLKRLPASLRCNLIDRAPYHSMRSLGSVALEWCWLAAGRSSIYLHGGQRLWDYAAGRLVFAEAGGRYAAGLNLRQLGDDGAGLQPLLAMAACSGSLFAQWKDCLLDCQK